MTEKEFLIQFAEFYKTVKTLHYEARENEIRAFCEQHDLDDRLEMAGFVSSISNSSGFLDWFYQAVLILMDKK